MSVKQNDSTCLSQLEKSRGFRDLKVKKAIVAEVHEVAKAHYPAVVADSRGVTVGNDDRLRKQARASGVWVKSSVTLARVLWKAPAYECLVELCRSNFNRVSNDTQVPARILADFASRER